MSDYPHHPGSRNGAAGRWIFWGFVLVAAYFLLTEHRAHTIQYLPFLLLLACPLMHLFHGHGRHGKGNANGRADDTKPIRASPDGGEDRRSTHH